MPEAADFPRLRLGVSACLLGRKVRYDGQHKQDRFLLEVLDRYVDWLPICPEVEIGLGIPRPTIRLEHGDGDDLRLVMPQGDRDLTATMRDYAAGKCETLAGQRLTGYVLKSSSPSCGAFRVKVYPGAQSGPAAKTGRGLFAEALMARFPCLPVEEEGRLNDARLRENFITRLFAYQRWLDLVDGGLTRRRLMHFHERHKYLLTARSQAGAKRLGRLLAQHPKGGDLGRFAEVYLAEFSSIVGKPPTHRGHTNVLQHIAGFVSDRLDPGDRAELTAMIDAYRRELLPLIVPVTMLRHYARKYDVPYIQDQIYLNPHPHELMLLNHV